MRAPPLSAIAPSSGASSAITRLADAVGEAEPERALGRRDAGVPVLLEEEREESRHHRGGERGVRPVAQRPGDDAAGATDRARASCRLHPPWCSRVSRKREVRPALERELEIHARRREVHQRARVIDARDCRSALVRNSSSLRSSSP